jgi:hypothetical protein
VADAEKNPVERRLDYLSGLWEQFAANPAARLLRWVADGDGRQMAETFLEVHKQDPAGIPDLFLAFDLPFRDETSYAADLLRYWKGWYDENRDGLIEESLDPTWHLPPPRAGEPGFAAVGRTAKSFREFYGADFRNLAVALVPNSISDPAAWARWLSGLVKPDLPPEVRFLVLDDLASPALKGLAEREPAKVVSQTLEIDGVMLYRELLARAGGTGPGVVFRDHYAGMLIASKAGNFAAAITAGTAALAVATAEGWPHLAVAASFGIAGLLAATGKPAESLAGYRQAVAQAEAAAAAGDPIGPKLVVQSKLGEAGSLFAAQNYPAAAAVYEDAAPKATAAGDHLLAMESWRMAAAAHELGKADDKAWECGQNALAAGGEIDPEMRPQTTLPFAGQGLLRLTKKKPFAEHRDKLVKTMNALVGPGWEDRRPC